jgi:Fe2+ transport system protein FeoA
VRVVRVTGGPRLVHRLAAVGVVPGSLLTVVRARGPAVIALDGARVAVGRRAAMAIEVEELPA